MDYDGIISISVNDGSFLQPMINNVVIGLSNGTGFFSLPVRKGDYVSWTSGSVRMAEVAYYKNRDYSNR